MVGSLTPDVEKMYGKIFAPYLADPQTLFVISSDFCHWGQRFRYTYHNKSHGQIYKSIEHLDKTVSFFPQYFPCNINFFFFLKGMDIIESLNPNAFTEYLKTYGNTICGRHPIGVLLQAVNVLMESGYKPCFKFLKYAQSSQCTKSSDSSVSYASGSLIFD